MERIEVDVTGIPVEPKIIRDDESETLRVFVEKMFKAFHDGKRFDLVGFLYSDKYNDSCEDFAKNYEENIKGTFEEFIGRLLIESTRFLKSNDIYVNQFINDIKKYYEHIKGDGKY